MPVQERMTIVNLSSGDIGIIAFLVVLVYIPGTWVMFRCIKLRGWVKVLFCLTIVPVFTIFMLFNMWVSNKLLPGIFRFVDSLVDMGMSEGGLRGAVFWAFLFSTPIAIGLSYAWYRGALWLDERHNGPQEG